MQKQLITYEDDGVLLEATVIYPVSPGKKPLVFIFPPWEGKGSFVEGFAEKLAALGYIGCAMDPYGKGCFGRTREECSALMTPFMNNRKKNLQRILSYQHLLSKLVDVDEERMGAVGFCFGGLCALDLARSGAKIRGVVSFHGLLNKGFSYADKSITSKVLVCHGYKDPMVSPQDLLAFTQEMEEQGVDFQVHIFGEAMHAFTHPEANNPSLGTLFHKISSQRAELLMKNFFSEIF